MAVLGDFVVKVGANVTQLEHGLKKAQSSMKKFSDELSTIGGTLTKTITLPILGIGAAAIKMSSDMEQSKIAFETLTGGATEAQRTLQDLFDFALETPFTFVGLQESAKRLIAMGFEARQIIPTMQSVGDAVAAVGGGQDVINRVTLALGQMQAKGKVSAEEMRQLAEAGIPAWELLANVLNTTVQDAMKQVQNRAVNSGTAIQGLFKQMNSRFSGLMKKQVKTVFGRFSILRDQLNKILIDIGDDLSKTFKISDKIKALTDQIKKMDEVFLELSDTTKTLAFSLLGALAIMAPILTGLGLLITLASAVAGALSLTISQIGLVVGGLIALVTGTIALVINWEKFKKTTSRVWKNISKDVISGSRRIIKAWLAVRKALFLPDFDLDFIESLLPTQKIKLKIEIDNKAIGEALGKFKGATDKFKKEAGNSQLSFVDRSGINLPEPVNPELSVILKQLQNDLALAKDKSKLLGDSFDFAHNKASLLQSAISDLLKAQVSVDDPTILKLAHDLKNLTNSVEESTEPFTTMEQKLQSANDLFSLLGTSFDLNGQKAAIFGEAIRTSISQGVSIADPQLLALRDRLLKVQNAMDGTTTKLVTLESAFRDGFQKIGTAGIKFAKNMAINLATGASSWKSILQTFLSQAIGIIVQAAFAAMGIAKLVSQAMANMFNPLGFLVIGGLLVALTAISSSLGSSQASLASGGGGGGGGISDTTQADIPQAAQPQNIVIINGNLVDLAQLSRELEDFNVELVRDTI